MFPVNCGHFIGLVAKDLSDSKKMNFFFLDFPNKLVKFAQAFNMDEDFTIVNVLLSKDEHV